MASIRFDGSNPSPTTTFALSIAIHFFGAESGRQNGFLKVNFTGFLAVSALFIPPGVKKMDKLYVYATLVAVDCRMKRLSAIIGGMMMVCQLQADPVIDWVSDSYDSFDVILTGNGAGWSGTITSPSDLWEFHSANNIQYPFSSDNPDLPPLVLGNSGYMTFLGLLPSQFPGPDPMAVIHSVSIGTPGGYMQFCDPAAPAAGANPMNYGYLSELSTYGSYQDWSGISTFSITSIPDVNNVSGWTWQAEYKAAGQSLEVAPVPEPGTASLVVLAGLFMITFRFCKKRNPAWVAVPARLKKQVRRRLDA